MLMTRIFHFGEEVDAIEGRDQSVSNCGDVFLVLQLDLLLRTLCCFCLEQKSFASSRPQVCPS